MKIPGFFRRRKDAKGGLMNTKILRIVEGIGSGILLRIFTL
jgi:hypothetical protein